MTIERRLFFSNILMIVLPIIVTAVMFFAIRSVSDNNSFVFVEQSRANIALQLESLTKLDNGISIYQADTGSYIIVTPDGLASGRQALDGRPGSMLWALFLALLLIVFLTNRALTKYISRHIMTPLDTLVHGVTEISDGNLDYRIKYDNGDEFDTVCTHFNEMASRLSDMVKQRQIDEVNRKELIAGISHDLKTPLTSIKGHIEGLRKGIAKSQEMQDKYLGIIQSKAEDVEYILSQLFLFSQIDIGEFPFNLETVDIGKELEKMIAGFADEYGEQGMDISLMENADKIYADIDPVQFRNVVQNILNNSVKYGNRKDPVRAEIFCRRRNGSVSITINDNGPGVPDDKLKKIFEVFYRSDISRNDPSKGSGLGLAISSRIIERLHGSITAENVRGGGLSIIITLPERKGGHV